MKPFDRNATCPKCGGEHVSFEYQARYQGWPEDAHMKRKCVECGHVWPEAPLDAAPEARGEAT